MTAFARLVFPLPLSRSFLYRIPEPLRERARPGTRARAPFGQRTAVGFLVGLEPEPPPRESELKDLMEILDDRPIWGQTFLGFTRELASEYFSSWGEILQASLPPSLAPKTKTRILPTAAGREALGKKGLGRREREILSLLEGTKGRAPLFLQRRTGIRNIRALLTRMAGKGLVVVRETEAPAAGPKKTRTPEGIIQLELGFGSVLSEHPALEPVLEKIGAGEEAAFTLIGSDERRGEVYEILARRALDRDGRVLLLVPEVSMTGGVVSRIRRRLGREAAVFHGGLTARQKEISWRTIRSGRAPVVVGTRSALFLDPDPFALIIVDGEHEESFLQTVSPAYDARRGARLRARKERGVVVLGSDRPSVEAFYEAERQGRLLRFDAERTFRQVVWATHPKARPLISGILRDRIGETLGQGGSAVVFLNRRGYASSPVCSSCGHVPRCRACDIPMVFHREGGRLVCRYCNASVPSGGVCPRCGDRYILGKGPGTQALEEELAALFPSTTPVRFDADTASGPKERKRILQAFAEGRAPLLVGTQLLAYEPRLRDVRLLAVLSPETLLGSADFEASQKTFQTVSQMMSLAGPGTEIVVQTSGPPHFSVRTAAEGDYGGFYEKEIAFRRLMNYPPFGALAVVTLMGTKLRALAANARRFRDVVNEADPTLELLGPALAAVVRTRNIFRIQVVLKAPRRKTIVRILGDTLPLVRAKKAVLVSYSPFE